MKHWCGVLKSNQQSNNVSEEEVRKLASYVEALYLDLTGEIKLAIENSQNYGRWGKHFLPSIRRAHQLQQCNNFKDPGVQFYGGPLFNSLRDEAEDMFCTLPAPTSSYSSTSAPYDMSAYMNASAGCISGGCEVLLSDGSIKLMKEMVKGDKVSCNASFNNPQQRKFEATVECVVRTRCANKVEMVRFPGGLIATPWHPVYLLNQSKSKSELEWVFPMEHVGESELLSEEWIYNLVLGPMNETGVEDHDSNSNNNKESNRGQSFVVNGLECISLAHGITNDRVAEHEFYGSEKVVQSLQSLVGIESYLKTGLVTMESSQVVRNPITGLVCDYQEL